MGANPEKDFGAIADDYAFFETHATEAEADARAYGEQVKDVARAGRRVRMLDFGCGSGTFTARFLEQVGWPAARLELTLVEPVDSVRRQAVARLGGFTNAPIAESPAVPAGIEDSFDLVLANHVLYYVPDLRRQLARLIDALSAGGVFVTAIAARSNALIEIWIAGFGLLGREVPYHTSEDVEAALGELGADYQKEQVAYELAFPDTEANRMRILRFLLAEHLAEIPQQPLLDCFDRYRRRDRIVIQTASDHYTVRPGRDGR
jgi:trans-aconitate 2-methyltransferase